MKSVAYRWKKNEAKLYLSPKSSYTFWGLKKVKKVLRDLKLIWVEERFERSEVTNLVQIN